ncbi:FAD-dependent oxidoreductase [Ottowia sp.]|uniref:FAD-dependent oxidoreductase n=1 Tax=Ottowia sp. TaxID=1898956 RepID=UPI002CB80EC9|nr:FAD-dependent oxidoreductase [Ottowia sp.]HOB66567.1 FAD-dependent oxidoreductase [Ottowia sp.]HQD47894.1 FAD-dependent oxidoreductase [Ottowia sp.]
MSDRLHVGIAGAGLLGRLLAWRLSQAGRRVSVFDPAVDERAVVRSQAPEPYVPTAAGFTAAGMLSPLSELDNAEPAVAALGWRSLALWPQIAAALPGSPTVMVGGSLLVAHRPDLGAAQRVLARMQAAAATPEWRAASPAEGVQTLDAPALREMEPSIQGPAHAWLLPGEGFVDTVAMMNALYSGADGAHWHWGQRVLAVEAGEGGGTLRMADGRMLAFDVVIDVRGTGAGLLPRPSGERAGGRGAEGDGGVVGPHPNALPEGEGVRVRGVRGEVIWLDCPGHGLTRPVRLLHPRHRVYIVPRTERDVIVGASEIESEDRSPVSLRSAVELMAAAHSVVPALAEARIVKMDVNLRPALPDNNPLIEQHGRLLRINGLFRHGWLLAPALVEQAARRADAWWLNISDQAAPPAERATVQVA